MIVSTDLFKVGDSAWICRKNVWQEWMVRERTRRGYVMQRRGADAEPDTPWDIVFVRTQDANRSWATFAEMREYNAFAPVKDGFA